LKKSFTFQKSVPTVICVASTLFLSCCSEVSQDVQRLKPAYATSNPSGPSLQFKSSGASVPAANVKGMDGLPALVKGTLETQSEILAAAENFESALARIGVAQSGYLPQLSLGISGGVLGDDQAKVRPQLTGTQMLYDFGRTRRAVSRGELSAQYAHLEFLDTVIDNLAETAIAQARYKGLGAEATEAQERLTTMTRISTLISERESEGLADVTGGLEARRRVQTAETILLQVQVAQNAARRDLERRTGVSRALLNAPMTKTTPGCGTAPALDQIPAVLMSRLDYSTSQTVMEDAQKSRLPVISLKASTTPDSGSRASTRVGVNIGVSAPVFQGGAARAQSASAVRDMNAAAARIQSETEDARNDFDDAVSDAEDASVIIGSLERQAVLLDDTRALYQSQYLQLGSRSLNDLLDAEEEYYQVRQDIALSRTDHAIAQIECLKASGAVLSAFGLTDRVLFGLILAP
jgi:adhesin transport system outer membrane protein